jgi:hypothetical protein
MANARNSRVPGELSRLRSERGCRCLVCGTPADLEFAHLRPTGLSKRGRGRKERLYDIKKNPFDYALLCKGQHGDLDHDAVNFVASLDEASFLRFMDLYNCKNYKLEPLDPSGRTPISDVEAVIITSD